MMRRRYYQFLQSLLTINTAFSSPQVSQGQVNDFHLAFSPPFGSFDAAASSKDLTNAIPMHADYPFSPTWNPDLMAVSESQGPKDENFATASNFATDSISAPSSSESWANSDSVARTKPSADSESSYLSTDDQSLLPAPVASLPSSTNKLGFKLDGLDEAPFPIPLIRFFQIRLPEFHDDGTRQWLPEQKPPTCEGTYYLFCCEQGAPTNGVGRSSRRTKDDINLSKRRRICKRYNKHFAQCYFPENIFCCFCRDGFQNAYECYNFYWQNDPSFQNQPIREPRRLPKPRKKTPIPAVPAPGDSSIDPEEPSDQQDEQRRRRRATSSSSLDFSAASDQSQLYAEKKPMPKRVKEMCTDEYIRAVGVAPRA